MTIERKDGYLYVDGERFYTADQAGDKLAISGKWIRRLVNEQRLTGIKFGSGVTSPWYISERSLMNFSLKPRKVGRPPKS